MGRVGTLALAFFWTGTGALAATSESQPTDQTFARFRQWHANFVATQNAESKSRLLPEGRVLALERREAMKQIIRQNPARGLALAEAPKVRQTLPKEIAALLEERISGLGEIRVCRDGAPTAGISEDGLAREVHLNGRVFAAHVYGWRLVDQDFTGVPLDAIAVDGVMAVAECPLRVLDPEELMPEERQPGKIATIIGGQIQFFQSQGEVERKQLELMYGRGVPVPGPKEEAARATQKKVRRVRPNALALQRINERRRQQGLSQFAPEQINVQPLGQELEFDDAPAPPEQAPPPPTVGNTDNSDLQYFPPIRSQGSLGSCSAFSISYYQMTYMTALARGWNAKTGGDSYRFSPKWTYNFLNGGTNVGVSMIDSFYLVRDLGCATWQVFPYDTNYRSWCLNSNEWRAAIGVRMNSYSTITSLYTANGLTNLMTALDDGYVATFDTYAPWSYDGWVQGTVTNDPSTPDDDAFVGQQICKYVRALDWGHAMTVVGYNDDIWCDLNGNGVVDSGEKGALKIANSWGNWGNGGGYAWFAYDALKTTSGVPSWNPSDKVYGFGYGDQSSDCIAYLVTAQTNYTPKALGRFTINHAYRNQMTMRVGKGATNLITNPTTTWTPTGLSGDGGPYAFDGTTTPCDATFWLDMTSLNPDLGTPRRYFTGMIDNSTSGNGRIKSFTLVDAATGGEITVTPDANPNSFNPTNGLADASTAWTFINLIYGFHDLSLGGPSVKTEGDSPLSVQLGISPAPVSNLVVTLSSSDTTEATTPATVTVPAGQTNVSFNVSIVDDGGLDGTQTATITATSPLCVTGSLAIAVRDNETAILSVTLPASPTEGEGSVQGAVHVSAPVASDVGVTLISSDTSELTVPPTVTIPAGQSNALFTATVINDAQIDGGQAVTVRAQVEGWTEGLASVTVQDNETVDLTLVMPASASEGNGVLTNAGRVRISGTLGSSLAVSLSSDDTTELAVPASVTISAGQTNALFNVTIVDDTDADGAQSVAVTASAGGFNGTSASTTVRDNELHHFGWAPISSPKNAGTPFGVVLSALDVNSATIGVWTGSASLSGAGDSGEVTVSPESTTAFTNGVWSGNLRVNTPNTNVRLTANDGASHTGQSNPFDVQVGPLHHFGWLSVGSTQYVGTPFPVTIMAQDAASNIVSSFTNTVVLSGISLGQGSDSATNRILNPSFEAGAYAWGEAKAGWFAQTNKSQPNGGMPTHGATYKYIYTSNLTNFNLGDYCCITQRVDLSDLGEITFDASLWAPAGWSNKVKAQIRIDGTSVWTQTAGGLYTNQSINVSSYVGLHTLELRSQVIVAGTYGSQWVMFDNLRCGGSGGEILFQEDFEDGNYDGWTTGSGTYVRQVTNDTSAEGQYSLTMIGGNAKHGDGLSHPLASLAPDQITFHVRSSTATNSCGYFVAGEGYSMTNLNGTNAAIWFYMGPTGTMNLVSGSGTRTYPYLANRWYKNTFKINWASKTVDWFVDDALAATNALFRGRPVSNLASMDLYNYTSNSTSQAWWDEIQLTANGSGTIRIDPTNSGSFAGGVWSGAVTVLQPATGVWLVAADSVGHTGTGNVFAVVAAADLAIASADFPDPVWFGSNLLYVVTVTNLGPCPATGVTVTNILPLSVSLGSASASQGTWSQVNEAIIWSLGSLATNQFASLSMNVIPDAAGFVTNRATLAALEIDPVQANNSALTFTLVLRDTDGDGMDDAWEDANGLDPDDPSDAHLDPDGDGLPNLDEYRANTDPHNRASCFTIASVSIANGQARIRFHASAQRVYQVEFSTDLVHWDPLPGGLISGIEGMAEVVDSETAVHPARFYRARTQP